VTEDATFLAIPQKWLRNWDLITLQFLEGDDLRWQNRQVTTNIAREGLIRHLKTSSSPP